MKAFLYRFSLALVFITATVTKTEAQDVWKKNVLNYLQHHLAKSDGGFGWGDQYDSHIAPTFAAIGTLYDMGELPQDKNRLIAFVRTHHPQRTSNKETGPSGFQARKLLYYQLQALVLLGDKTPEFKEEVSAWKSDARNLYNYETHNYGEFENELMQLYCSELLGLPVNEQAAALLPYLRERRRSNGSFNNAPAKTGGDGNVLTTYQGLKALHILGEKDSLKAQTAIWLQACQLNNGGFTHQPKPSIAGNDDVAYTWAAVKALELCGAKPANTEACIRYLASLRNEDGGFANQSGLPSDPIATYYAVDALKALAAFAKLDKIKTRNTIAKAKTDFSSLNIYSVQFEAQGSGSPAEAVMLADSLGIHLWGTKNGHGEWSATAKWIAAAQKIAAEKKVPVTFFCADEPYGKNITVEGMGSFGHVLDYISPGPPVEQPKANEVPWADYRKQVVDPLLQSKGALILQIANNEPLARMLLDESVRKGGYAAISTIHFNQNFLFFLPYLQQYRYQLPFIALQDAHGTESWWWSDVLTRYRTLILAKEPTYEGMMEALKNNWVVAVRHDSVSDLKTRMLGGAAGVQEYMKSKENQWRWWNDDATARSMPVAAITVVAAADSFEVGRPDKGVAIRIRTRWYTNREVLRVSLYQLQELRLDNKVIDCQPVDIKNRRDIVTDSYYITEGKQLTGGPHTIEAKFINLKDKSVEVIKSCFTYSSGGIGSCTATAHK